MYVWVYDYRKYIYECMYARVGYVVCMYLCIFVCMYLYVYI